MLVFQLVLSNITYHIINKLNINTMRVIINNCVITKNLDVFTEKI